MHGLRYLATAGFMLVAFQAAAQGQDDGSLYSRYGLGELRSFPSSRAQAMGGGGTALWTLNYANYANPAALSRQALVRASAGMRFDNLQTTDASQGKKNLLAGSFSAIQFGLPLISNKLGLGFTFEPYSRVNYRVTTNGTVDIDPARDPSPYTVITQGSGGLQQLRIGVGARPASFIGLGASVDYLFGITEDSRRTEFGSAALLTTNVATTTRMRGFTVTGGGILMLTLGDDRELSIAGTATLPARLQANSARTVGESLDQDTLGTTIAGDLTLPLSTNFGIAYTADYRWTFTADLRYEPWTDFRSDFVFRGSTPDAMRDRSRISAGVEFLPAGSSITEPYLERTAFRLGVYVDNGYISPVAGQKVTTQAITAGVSLPTLFGGTRLDLNVQAGRRGNASGKLVQDRFVTVSATLNVGERWFLKRKLG